jgi:hypothetical protein
MTADNSIDYARGSVPDNIDEIPAKAYQVYQI